MTEREADRWMVRATLDRIAGDERGSAAVEFAMVCAPFVALLLIVLQMGIFYMAQSSLNTGVIAAADLLRTDFRTKPTATLPPAGTLKTTVATRAGALVRDDGNLAVEIRPLAALGSAAVSVVDGAADYGAKSSVLVLRAEAQVVVFVPGFGGLATIRSSAIVRRQEL